jgi:hypothetical protein
MHQQAKPPTPPAASTLVRTLSNRSEGQFNADDWIQEGRHLFASAKAVRSAWVVKRRKLSRAMQANRRWTHGIAGWADLEGPPKASVLLLGYAVEMFLKAGLAKAYHGCSEQMFDRDVRRFSHNFKKLAKAILFDATSQDKRDLAGLENMVVFRARYPIKPSQSASHADQKNARSQAVWSKSDFTRIRQMALRILAYVAKIDRDSDDPASFTSIGIDDDGYIACRSGGGLLPRVTYRWSTTQRDAGLDNLTALHALVVDEKLLSITRVWTVASFHEDDAAPREADDANT